MCDPADAYLGPSAKMRLAASTVLIASTLFIVFAKTRKWQGHIGERAISHRIESWQRKKGAPMLRKSFFNPFSALPLAHPAWSIA